MAQRAFAGHALDNDGDDDGILIKFIISVRIIFGSLI